MGRSVGKRKAPASPSSGSENLPPLDGEPPEGFGGNVIVEMESPVSPYHVLLHQTDIGNNSNKFYLLQVWNGGSGKAYYVWRRWGRVGYKGQTQLMPFGPSREDAIHTFKQKFYEKTLNAWGESKFVQQPRKYNVIRTANGGTVQKASAPPAKKKSSHVVPSPTLHPSLEKLISLITNLESMAQELASSLRFDTNRAPLGDLSEAQIRGGYRALKKIAECITKGQNCLLASNEYYSKIPHEFGMRVPPIIKSLEHLQEEIGLLEALGHVRVSYQIFKKLGKESLHPLDANYKALDIKLSPLNPASSEEFSIVEQYIQSTHAATHNLYTMDVEEVFSIEKSSKRRFKDVGNRKLLFHGSRLSNWAGILGKGLKIAPPEAPMTGYMFGKGVYFADISSKSANYCFATPSKNCGLLLLCEVALGNENELISADDKAHGLPKGKHSVKGLGKTVPGEETSLPNGTKVPLGPCIDTGIKNEGGYTLQYNEYVVYDVSQIRMKYLVQIKFNFDKN